MKVDNYENKIDMKKLMLINNSNAVLRSSKSPSFMNLCKVNAKSCDEQNMKIFNKFAKRGTYSSQFK